MTSVLKEDARDRAKKYIKEHGIKQSFIANKLGISESTLTSRLNGRLKFDANFALAFSKALDISADIFLK